MTYVTCRLTAKNRDQLRIPLRSVIEYGHLYLFVPQQMLTAVKHVADDNFVSVGQRTGTSCVQHSRGELSTTITPRDRCVFAITGSFLLTLSSSLTIISYSNFSDPVFRFLLQRVYSRPTGCSADTQYCEICDMKCAIVLPTERDDHCDKLQHSTVGGTVN